MPLASEILLGDTQLLPVGSSMAFLVISTPRTELNTLACVVLYSSLACRTLASSKFGSRALLAPLVSSVWMSPLFQKPILWLEREPCGDLGLTQQPES